jgi:DNA-binding NarL/FixJ family response regulator
VDATEDVQRGREAFARRAWRDAHDALSSGPLAADDLERLATAAYMLGDEAEYVAVLERAHQAHLEAGSVERAVRCAFWIGLQLTLRRELGGATGWLGRAQRLLGDRDCVERGYLALLAALQRGDEAELAAAIEAGQRFAEADLLAIAVHEQGGVRIRRGEVDAGLSLLDEAMVAVTAGELSPIVTGLIYCSVIEGCQQVHELRRAQEWTAALTRWCEAQDDLVAFTGRCLVHRAEIMQVHGAWADALEEARQAALRLGAAGQALYRQGELHRLQGDFEAAEQAYREASRHGLEPQPGLALLRLAQGRGDAAAAAIGRVLGEAADPLLRARLLPARIEIALATGDAATARKGCQELEQLAAARTSALLAATAAHARGAVLLDAGNARGALAALRGAEAAWQELDAPYEAARVRVLVARACAALGDQDSAALGLDAARAEFERLGAAPDLAALAARDEAHGLSPRELQVLRLVAAGETNKAIAAELVLSERTVERHVSNIFGKLAVSTRAAATAFAYEHGMRGITHARGDRE